MVIVLNINMLYIDNLNDCHLSIFVAGVLEKPFLQPRQLPIDHVRPRNLFVDCTVYLRNHPINYAVFKGIFHRRIKATQIDPNLSGTRFGGLRTGSNISKQKLGFCFKNCIDTGKRRLACKRGCRCRKRCKSTSSLPVSRIPSVCRKRCKHKFR